MRNRKKHRNPKPGIVQRIQTLQIWINSNKKVIRDDNLVRKSKKK